MTTEVFRVKVWTILIFKICPCVGSPADSDGSDFPLGHQVRSEPEGSREHPVDRGLGQCKY